MSKNIRCVKNCMLNVSRNGSEEIEEKFVFGRWYDADYIEEIDNEYINIHFKDGSVLYGIQRGIFEIGLAKIVPAPKQEEKSDESVGWEDPLGMQDEPDDSPDVF